MNSVRSYSKIFLKKALVVSGKLIVGGILPLLLVAIWGLGFSSSVAEAQEQALKPVPKGEKFVIPRLEFKKANVVDAMRLISELSGLNIVATQKAGEKVVTLYLQNIKAREAIDTLSKVSGLWYRKDKETGAYRVMTTEEYQVDLVIFREDYTRVFTLLHPNAVSVASTIEDLYGDRVLLSFGQSEQELSASQGGPGSGGLGFGLGGPGGGSTGLSSRFSRSVRPQQGFESQILTRQQSVRGQSPESERIVKESFTPRQLQELERRMRSVQVETGEDIPSDALRGLTRQDPPIYVSVIREHNVIVVRTSDAEVMEDIERLISQLDRPTPQVLLEMKILELKLGDSSRSIFDAAFVTGSETAGPPTGMPPNPFVPGATTGPENILGMGNFPLEGGTLIYQFMSDQIRARIQFLAKEDRINILATPLILAANNRPAKVFVGEERVLTTGVETGVVTPASGATTTVIQPITEVRDIGNTLVILPKINADRTVTLSISQDTSTVLLDSATIPVASATGAIQEILIDTVNTANLQGTVVAKDGLSVAVGGLIRTSVNEDEQKVPLLGDIPFLKYLFSRQVKSVERHELVLLITPHILMTPAEGHERTQERIRDMMQHPYLEEGDDALESYFNGEEKDTSPALPDTPPSPVEEGVPTETPAPSL